MFPRSEPPGVVVVAARAQKWGGWCTGSVVKTVAAGREFDAYVLTARHCLVADEVQGLSLGVTVPRYNEYAAALESTVFGATVAHVSSVHRTVSAGSIVWDDGDWAILRVRTPVRWPVIKSFDGDPANAIPAGDRVELLTYFDGAFFDFSSREVTLVPHAHPFHWTGVPRDIPQGGHSGAPVLKDGQIVAMFVGSTSNRNYCRWFCLESWPEKLRFVSIASIRAQAARAGFGF
jgi:hypothetical protein